MPMEREKYEEILNSLLDQSIEHSQRVELLQTLRADYSTVISEHEEHTKKLEKLQKDNADLIVSNSKLFRQIGIQDDETLTKEEEKKTFSETVTVSQLEKNANTI